MNWGILSTGVIAKNFAETAKHMDDVHIHAVSSRTKESADAFADQYAIPVRHVGALALAQDPDVDIVYIATPHNAHYEGMKLMIENGKHVLCEKSFTTDAKQAEEIFALAREKGVFVMEAFWTKLCPVCREVERVIASGEIGDIRAVTAQYGYTTAREARKFDPEQAGGTLLDIGVYALSMVRSYMLTQPDRLQTQWLPAPSGVDEQATVLLQNMEGQMATVALSLHSKQPKRAMISCEKGYIEIMEYPRADRAIIVDAQTGAVQTIEEGSTADALYYEMTDMEKAILTGEHSAMQLDFTRDVMDIMTKLRAQWGLTYPEDE